VRKKGFFPDRAPEFRPRRRRAPFHSPHCIRAKSKNTSLLAGSDVNFRHKQAQNRPVRAEEPTHKAAQVPTPLLKKGGLTEWVVHEDTSTIQQVTTCLQPPKPHCGFESNSLRGS